MSWNATVDCLRGQAQQYGLASDYVTAKLLYQAVDEIERIARERDEARAQADGLAKAHRKATLGLMAATSAYREFAKGRDALYGTRVKDFERATEAALAALPKEDDHE